MTRIGVTAWSVHVPGTRLRDLVPGTCLPGLLPEAGPACPPEHARDLLGRKGLLYKEAATRLALCAVHRALGYPPRAPRPGGPADPRSAVVVSSNLGNAGTVAGIARTIRDGSGRDVSPLQAPNASSNVIASAVAIWFRLGGPNLTVCSGAAAGLDALALASLLLRAGRADRVIVVGAEPDDPDATGLHRRRMARNANRELCAGAACVVLERSAAHARQPVLGPVRRVRETGADGKPAPPDPGAGMGAVLGLADHGPDLYGAAGVVYAAAGAALLTSAASGAPGSVTLACGDDADGWSTAQLNAGHRTGAGRDEGEGESSR